MGIYNSSLTRVQPFFRILEARDPSGLSWVPQLLALSSNSPQAVKLAAALTQAEASSRVALKFERRLPPPTEFLRWQIQNQDQLTWPKRDSWSPETRSKREKLFGRRDLSGISIERHAEVRALDYSSMTSEALSALATHGASGSSKKWWAFEGFTSVDCLISTGRFRLYIEGKRTEGLSRSINWYPKRNQFLRNLESARADAEGVPFGCLVISEHPIAAISDTVIRESLPHLDPAGRSALLQNYLGNITWREACHATGVDFSSLPETT
jgi:hypothetical protein